MGLEVNYHPQYGTGSPGEKIEKRDFEYKRIMMEDLLQVRKEEGETYYLVVRYVLFVSSSIIRF